MNKKKQMILFGFFLGAVFGTGMFSSCGNNFVNVEQTVEGNEIETDSVILEGDTSEYLFDRQTDLEQTTLPELYEIERIVNIEEADLTQDGVMDKVVSKICYLNEYETDKEMTINELMNSRYGVVYTVCVYDGNGLNEKEIMLEEGKVSRYSGGGLPIVEYGKKLEGNCIWERDFATAHAGNGWLFLITYNGKDCLLYVSSGIWQGVANFQYRIVSFTEECEEILEKENEVQFTTNQASPGDAVFPIDEMIAYTEDLEQQLKDSVLLVYTDVEQGARVRAFEEECTANAFDAWSWLKQYNNDNDFTIESLRETMERYYKEEWDFKG